MGVATIDNKQKLFVMFMAYASLGYQPLRKREEGVMYLDFYPVKNPLSLLHFLSVTIISGYKI